MLLLRHWSGALPARSRSDLPVFRKARCKCCSGNGCISCLFGHAKRIFLLNVYSILRARKDKKCNHFNKASVKLFARNFLEFILKLRARKDTKCNHFNAAPIATSLTTKATWLVVLSHTNHRLDDKATKHGFEGRFGASCPSRVGPCGLGSLRSRGRAAVL